MMPCDHSLIELYTQRRLTEAFVLVILALTLAVLGPFLNGREGLA